MNNLSDEITRKFVESYSVDDWEIETDSGWQSISQSHKTVPYQVWKLVTESGKFLEAADTHILFDSNFEQIFLKDCIPNQTYIQTKDGTELVTEVSSSDDFENMYDLEVDSEDHRYYTNGILSHNTIIVVAYFLWKVIFNESTLVGMFADKNETANGILEKLQLAYEELPLWLQQGVKEWGKGKILLENRSGINCGATTGNSGRSKAYKYILLDEFAFVQRNLQSDFYRAVYPVITSGNTAKLFMISTPNGLNLFYKIWADAEKGENQFKAVDVHWSALPGRDEAWKAKTISNIGQDAFLQEYDCQFLGSAGKTLISVTKLKEMPHKNPIQKIDDLEIYVLPEQGRTYCLTADTSQGIGLDYSAFTITDVTTLPYIQVARYRNNSISQLHFPMEIYKAANMYNKAYVLLETNEGRQVGEILYSEIEYEHQIFTHRKWQSTGQKVTLEYANGAQPGLQMTAKVKKTALSNLKHMIETDQLIINDFETISELSSFIQAGPSYSAEAGCHDDLVMTQAVFSWFAMQPFFKELTSDNFRDKIREEREKVNSYESVDKFFKIDGVNDEKEFLVMDDMVWYEVGGEQEHPVERAWKNAGVRIKNILD